MKVRKLINVLAVLFVMAGLVAGMTRASASMAASDGFEKIEAALLDRFTAEGQADFIVRFADQADLSAAYSMDEATRGQWVVDTLTAAANSSQVNAKSILDAQSFRYVTFIAGNELYVWAGNLDLATSLASLSEVASIRATRTFYIDPVEVTSALDNINWAGDLLANSAYMAAGDTPNALAWGIIDTGADQFWTAFGVQGDGIKVANIDTGVQWNHPALDQSFACPGDPGNAACWSDPENWCGGTACDNNGHGTHTMGTMVADDDPGLTWQAGMAPNSTWIACKGCGTSSCSDFALNSCADWILAPGGSAANAPDVVNNSWGGTPDGDPWYLAKVNAWRAAGIFPAFSAGNSGSTCDSMGDPGSYQESFASAAHDSGRIIAGFSSRGPSAFGHDPYTKPNISAPGVSVCSTVPGSGWSCGYSGTSMASPHTAGAVALLWSCNPALVGQIDLTFQILQNAIDVAPAGNCGAPPDGEGNYTYGYGYLNVLTAGIANCGGVDTGYIDGYVFEADGTTPISGASVTATPSLENSIEAITDPTGYYTMTLVTGTYDVTASKLGYSSQTVTGVVVTAGATTPVNFQLDFLGQWTLDPAIQCFDLTRIDSAFYAGTGMIYVLGGRGGADGGSTFGNIYEIDPLAGTCADTGELMPTPISNYTINIVNDGSDDLLCTFGGRTSTGATTLDVQCYNPATNTATVVAQLPGAWTGYTPGAQVVYNNNVYIFGGFNSTTSPYMTARTERYNPVTNSFTQLDDLNMARSYIMATVVDGVIYAFGGDTFDGASLIAQTISEVMADPEGAATWDDAALADLPVAGDEGRAFGFDMASPYAYANQIVIATLAQWSGDSASVVLYDIASDTYDVDFPDLNIARRNHGGTIVPLVTADPLDGLPGMWVIGGRMGADTPPYAEAEYFPLSAPMVEPVVDKTAPAEANTGDTFTYNITLDFTEPLQGLAWMTDTLPVGVEYAGNLTFDFGNAFYDAGDNAVYWEYGYTAGAALPFSPLNGIDNPLIQASSSNVGSGYVPAPAANPEAVLWDQPLSSVNQAAYVNQDFTDFTTSSSFLADDFHNLDAWNITTIFVPGDGWNGFSTLMNATSLTWAIYADNAGVPDGDPSGGGNPAVWSITLAPTDAQVVISTGTPGGYPSNTTLNLATPVNLPAGDYWLVFYPTMSFGSGGQYGRQPADTTNDYTGQFINPGGAFGFGTDWQDWTVIGPTQQDIAFRIEGEVAPSNPSIVNISFDVLVTSTGGTIVNEAVLDYNGVVASDTAETLVPFPEEFFVYLPVVYKNY